MFGEHSPVQHDLFQVMDMDLYKQQIEHDTFDLRSVTKFVVETMLSLCAPARDPTIRAILALTDPVDVFRDVFSALDLMRLDLANFQLKTLRPTLLANSVQYEQVRGFDHVILILILSCFIAGFYHVILILIFSGFIAGFWQTCIVHTYKLSIADSIVYLVIFDNDLGTVKFDWFLKWEKSLLNIFKCIAIFTK